MVRLPGLPMNRQDHSQDRIEEYRRRARNARREAERMTSAVGREGFVKLARGWDEMAGKLLQDNERKQDSR
jgi:hypothetical protein